MTSPPIPKNEAARIEALRRYRILDSDPENSYDTITSLASFICEAPIALVSLIDTDRQWFKSKVGIDASETSRDLSFCAHSLVNGLFLHVEDATKDERFANNPLVTGDPSIRFYAGAPLVNPEGHSLGTLCVVDSKPRTLSPERVAALQKLASLVVTQMELRRLSREMAEVTANLKTLHGLLPMCAHCKGIRNDDGYWQQVEAYVASHTEATVSHSLCPECVKRYFPEEK